MVQKPIIAITTGDPCGIGAEITVKALGEEAVYAVARPLVISDARLIEQAIAICGSDLEVNAVHNPAEGKYTYGVIDVLDLKNFPLEDQKFGQVVKEAGRASYEFIEKAVQLALAGKIDGITTGPIHKEAINLAGYRYAGHTEILADLTNTPKVCMMLTDGHMRISHVTTHIPMAESASCFERILVIRPTHDLIKMNGEAEDAVAYNPHSGEFWGEEAKYILWLNRQ